MRSLRKLSNMTVSCYTNLSSIFLLLIWCLSAGKDVFAYEAFSAYDWLAMIACSVLLVFAQVLYFVSLQNLPAPALQPLQFMGLVYQFFFDLTCFGVETNPWQISGILFVVSISAFQVYQFFCITMKENKEVIDED